jgi:surfeit locus 1 family protein
MLRDLLRPRALVSHVLVLTVAGVCVALGQWQLARLGEVRDSNARLEARLAADPVDLASLVAAGPLDPDAYEFRRVEARGTYRPHEEVLQRNRVHRGRTGFHVLTPFELLEGGVVLVRRGWVPPELSEPPLTEAGAPAGVVTLTGVLERSVDQPGFGARDPEEGVLARVFHADATRLDRQVEGELLPVVLRLEDQVPAGPHELPSTLEPPVLDEANHLSYAVQWHLFAGLAVITYGAWLWTRRTRTSRDSGPDTSGRPLSGAARSADG